MLTMMSHNWWILALRGVAAIILGGLLLISPAITIQTLVLVFGVYAIINGVGAIWTAFQHRTQDGWWVHLLEGILSVVAGVLIFAYPAFATISATFFILYIIAFWAIFTGVMEVWAAIKLRKEIEGEFWLGLGGVLSIIFGAVLILFPGTGILTVLLLVAGYAIAFGVIMIILAFRLRGMRDQQGGTSTTTRQTV